MTIAELARFFNDELHIGADLHLVRPRTVDERFGRPATREALLRGEDAAAVVA
jgi:hypothetical protein